MDTENHKPPCYRVGDLLVELGTRHVVRGNREIPMPGLSFDLLLALIRAAPNIVSIDQLMDQIWPGLVVNHETVTQRVKLLRDALGDDSRHPRYLALVRGHGYRLIAPVSKPEPGKNHAAHRFHARLTGLLALLALSLLALGLHDGASVFTPGNRAMTPERSLAVLPFVSLPGDAASADFLADAPYCGRTSLPIRCPCPMGRCQRLPAFPRTSIVVDSFCSAISHSMEKRCVGAWHGPTLPA